MICWKKLLLTALVCGYAMGCNVCEDLDARVCKDLGKEDCALWKENGLNYTAQAKKGGGRRSMLKSVVFGPGATMCRSAGKEPAYSRMLEATKEALAATRKAQE